MSLEPDLGHISVNKWAAEAPLLGVIHRGLSVDSERAFRRLPAQVRVQRTSTCSKVLSSSSIVKVVGLSTRPLICSRCCAHWILGTGPWLRT